MIAPFWTPGYLDSDSGVYYLRGGSEQNPYFVVEWHNLKGGPASDPIGKDDSYTFELILYPNGEIRFQYVVMSAAGTVYYPSIGIEDSTGWIGLVHSQLLPAADTIVLPRPNTAVLISPPTPAPRLSVTPPFQHQFVRPNVAHDFPVEVRNTGEPTSDTFDLTTTAARPVSLYGPDGFTALTDTDGDGTVDTGPLDPGDSLTVIVRTPAMTQAGASNHISMTTCSSIDSAKCQTITLQAAIPVPFAQALRDDTNNAMSIYLSQTTDQEMKKATADHCAGVNMAIAETASGRFFYSWSKTRPLGSISVKEISYSILDQAGEPISTARKLADLSDAALTTSDSDAALAVAPNGRIGVVWQRTMQDGSGDGALYNYNIYFAVLDEAGNLIHGPENVTSNSAWGPKTAFNVPWFLTPYIAATDNNRFVLTWKRAHQVLAGFVDDLYFTIRDTGGQITKSSQKLTNDSAGPNDGFYTPTITAIAGGKVLITCQRAGNTSDIYYVVLDSAGTVIKNPTNISGSDSNWDYRPDAIQLANGRSLIAWTSEIGGAPPGSATPYLMATMIESSPLQH